MERGVWGERLKKSFHFKYNTRISQLIFVVLNQLFVTSSTNKILRTIFFFLPFFTTFALGQ
jgi:hypothetical protein